MRTWFILGVFGLFLLGSAAAWVYYGVIIHYEQKAAQFDLSKLENLESASLIYDRNGNLYGKIFIQNREQVALDQISPHLPDAVVSAEDNHFYEHLGIDVMGMVRAAFKNTQAGRIRQGASTLTQQLARNTFDIRERTLDRKILEVFLSMRIEKALSKDKIMELYLNRVYFGGGLYGAEAAARGYFGKPAKDLTIGEAAMLAGLLKSPNYLSPWHNLEAAQTERDFVLQRMVENNKISAAQAKEASGQPLQVKPKANIVSQSYVIDLVRQQVQSALGVETLQSDGYKIYTTIDPLLQRTAEQSLQRELSSIETRPGYQHQTFAQYADVLRAWRASKAPGNAPPVEYLQGAVLAVDNRSGGILAVVSGRDYAQSEYNRAFQSKRPTGAAFAPFVFAAALNKDVFPGSLFEDSIMDNRQVMIGGTTGILGEWSVEKSDNRYEGPIPMRRVFAESKNAATVRVGNEAGLDAVAQMAKKAGIEGELRPYPSTYLGSSEVTLADLVTAYTTFPDQGSRPAHLTIVTKIETQNNRTIFRAATPRQFVMDPQIAFEVHSFLTDALANGTGAKARTQDGMLHFPAGGKTGTAYNFTDLWFVGYDSAITCGVWAGFDKASPIYYGAFSSDIALPVWTAVMNASLAGFAPRELSRPIDLKRVEVCLDTGLPASPKCALTPANAADPNEPVRKGTIFEFCTAAQLPKETCWLHGDDTRSFVRSLRNQDAPRATSATDAKTVIAVAMRQATVIGDDPYRSIKPRPKESGEEVEAKVHWTPAPRAEPVTTPTAAPMVKRAQPVGPLDRQPAPPQVDLPPPDPVDLGNDLAD